MPNRLANETSPYLLQHAQNPVDWYPWGAEALAAARQQNKPIFLSIGYSACHWCHVMEHESFENREIAARLNAEFINIKVDREERPDLDQVYMQAVQAMTGRGGWPMSVFLTPELKPFYGGTYWPPVQRMGMPGFGQVIDGVASGWRERRGAVADQANELTKHLAEQADLVPGVDRDKLGDLSVELLRGAATALEKTFDPRWGGFGGAPKFPHPVDLRVLLRAWRRWGGDDVLHVVTHTLDRMASGGIYDHLGGGFHRYSVDARWLVPHFEKMLYDNALLLVAYVEAWQATGRDDFWQTARESADYVLRDMTDPTGGFYSTLDADSEGVEGKYYVWTPAEIAQVLGADEAKTFCQVYDVTEAGNFEEHNILNLPKTIAEMAAALGREPAALAAELATSRARLLAVRQHRVPPNLDDKVLVSWNGLMIDALAQAGQALDEPRYVEAATRAAEFVWTQLRDSNGRLLHTWRKGKAKLLAYLDDLSCYAQSLISLYEATFDERWIARAVELADVLLAQFQDREHGGFFFTADDHEALLVRHRDLYDSATPSGNGMAATLLVRLGRLTGKSEYLEACEKTLRLALPILQRAPAAGGQMLVALDLYLGPTYEIAMVARDATEAPAVVAAAGRQFWPRKLIAARPAREQTAALDPLFEGRTAQGDVTAYVCEKFVCRTPIVGREAIVKEFARLARGEGKD